MSGSDVAQLCTEAEIIPNCLSAFYGGGVFVAGALAAYALRGSKHRRWTAAALAAALGAVRCALFAVPQRVYSARIHAMSSGGSCALDLFPEVLYFVCVWLFLLDAFVRMRREAITRVASVISPATTTTSGSAISEATPLAAREMVAATATRLEALPGAGQLGSVRGMLRRSELRWTRRAGALVAAGIPVAAAAVSVAVALSVPAGSYETVDVVVAVFRAVAAFALFACVAACLAWFPQHRAALAACALPVFLHGTFAAFDFKLRVPTVSCRVQYIVWAHYFICSEVPLYVFLLVLTARNVRSRALRRTLVEFRSSFSGGAPLN